MKKPSHIATLLIILTLSFNAFSGAHPNDEARIGIGIHPILFLLWANGDAVLLTFNESEAPSPHGNMPLEREFFNIGQDAYSSLLPLADKVMQDKDIKWLPNKDEKYLNVLSLQILVNSKNLQNKSYELNGAEKPKQSSQELFCYLSKFKQLSKLLKAAGEVNTTSSACGSVLKNAELKNGI